MNFVSIDTLGTAVDPGAPPRDDGLIGILLDDQADLSAVERFAQLHEHADAPSRARRYSALLPAAPPGPGQQLTFEVDLDRCSGCKACVAACHALNGLDEGEAWRGVGLLIGGGTGASPGLPVLQHVTSSCHHCLDPACLEACPAEAYEKDPASGIVRHLDDRCIGCQYCTLACPYDAPKFQPSRGIVRKCDMCGERLRAGEAPACVQACPHGAIRIRVVDVAELRARAESGAFLPGAFDPGYTRPTTAYRTRRPPGRGVRPADAHRIGPEHAHTPLAVMLVLTQLAVGGLLVDLVARLAVRGGLGAPRHLPLCLAIGLVGLGASLLHLGRPLHAYRAILGLGHSWLSREVLAFGVFAKLATMAVGLQWYGPGRLGVPRTVADGLLGAAAMAGLAAVGCSVMVYHVVRRPSWNAGIAGVKFAGTALVLGLAAALASVGISGPGGPGAAPGSQRAILAAISAALIAATAAKLVFEAASARDVHGTIGHTGRLLRGPLRRIGGLRRLLGLVGGVALPVLAIVAAWGTAPGLAAGVSVLALVASVGGELAERHLFFAAVGRPRMPGGLTA